MTAKSVLEYTKEMTLLYVEDDDGLRENTKLLFENFFLSVTTANDGQEGLNLYLESHASGNPYNMVISDINMPNMDGIAMAEAIFAKETLQPFIFITAHNEVSFLGSALHMGVSGFLTKPIQNDPLLKTLYRIGQAFCDRQYYLTHHNTTQSLAINT
jgi:CheY-like chemotaxis protein